MNVRTLLDAAELALAAYAVVRKGETAIQISELQDEGDGMALKQATAFAGSFPEVLVSYDDPTSGLQVSVFKDTSGDLPGNLKVAFRGAMGSDDVLAGADIVGSGAAYTQIVAMANWWAKVSAPKDETVPQFRLASYAVESVPANVVVLRSNSVSVYVLEESEQAKATGELFDALGSDPDLRVDVTGHSLGGHLAMAFSSLFAGRTGKVVAFNAPGFIDSQENQAFFERLGGSGASVPDSASILNIAGDEALIGESPFNFIARMHSEPGALVDIPIEKQTNSDEPDPFSPAFNHSIVALTDSLAVLSLLSDLDPTLDESRLGDYKAILSRSAQGTAGGLERIVDTLQALFELDRTALPVGNNRREVLYQAIYGVSQAEAEQQGTGQAIPGLVDKLAEWQLLGQVQIQAMPADAPSIIAAASQEGLPGLAYRYALKNLDPFVVLGDVTSVLYAQHNENGELDFHDAAEGTGALTQQWLQDRADFLERKLYINGLDTDKYYQVPSTDPENPLLPPDAQGVAYQNEARLFVDLGSGFTASSGPNPNALQNIIFGSDGADIIHPPVEGLADKLYGGAGVDFLAGYFGDDYLEGGMGFDVYQFVSGNAADTVLDTDGKGILVRNGAPLSVGVKISADGWQLGGTTYTRVGTSLEITFTDTATDKITLMDFDFSAAQAGGYLGIRLVQPGAVPAVSNVLTGDSTLVDTDSQAEGVQVGYDSWGNELTEEPETPRADALYGRDTEGDLIEGGQGDDVIFGDTEQLAQPGSRSNPQRPLEQVLNQGDAK